MFLLLFSVYLACAVLHFYPFWLALGLNWKNSRFWSGHIGLMIMEMLAVIYYNVLQCNKTVLHYTKLVLFLVIIILSTGSFLMDSCLHASHWWTHSTEVRHRCVTIYCVPEAPYSLHCHNLLSFHWHSFTCQLLWKKWWVTGALRATSCDLYG